MINRMPTGIAVLCGCALFAVAAGIADAQTPPPAGHGPYFPADSPWYQDVSAAPLDPESATVINWLSGAGGWGGGRMQIDFTHRGAGGGRRRSAPQLYRHRRFL